MYQTIIFDLDGTLLDTAEDLAAAGNYVCRLRGWPEHSVQAYRTMVGNGAERLVKRFSPPEAQGAEERAETLRLFNDYYLLHCAVRTYPYPGIPELIDRLFRDGVRMAVYSNKPDRPSRDLIDRFFPGMFALVRGKREGAPLKPDPSVLLAILEELGAERERTLFIGDSSVDVETGHNAGLRVCAVSWGFRPRESLTEAGAEEIADTAEALEAVIRGV